MMSETPRMSGEAFALERLRENPDLDYETLRTAGEEAGIALLPIQFGRARRQLGLTNTTPQRSAPPEPQPQPEPQPEPVELQAAASAPVLEPVREPERVAPPAGSPNPEQAPSADSAPVPGPGLSRPSTPAFEFLVEELRAQPTVSYGELKTRADDKGLKIAPIMYGRAKALLGLVPVRPRGQGKNRKKGSVSSLPRAQSESSAQFSAQIESVRNLDDLVAIVKQLDAERRHLRATLEAVADQIRDALS